MSIEQPDNPDQPNMEAQVVAAQVDPSEDPDGPPLCDRARQNAIMALLYQPTILKAAQSIGVSERTLHRWIREPGFMTEYRRTRREAFAQAIGVSQRYAPLAVATLAQIMSDTKASHAARVTAASTILKFSRESLELDDLAERIEALEETTAQAKAIIESNQQHLPEPKSKARAA